jgi:hypothetical protein
MKTLLLSLSILCAGIIGCNDAPPVPLHNLSQSGVTIDEYLTFQITYTLALTQGRTLTVQVRSKPWLEDEIDFSDKLQQPDGTWVIFDCDRIADKIIDTNLAAEITPYCAQLHQQGKDYWESHDYTPEEFVDSQGTHWKKE